MILSQGNRNIGRTRFPSYENLNFLSCALVKGVCGGSVQGCGIHAVTVAAFQCVHSNHLMDCARENIGKLLRTLEPHPSKSISWIVRKKALISCGLMSLLPASMFVVSFVVAMIFLRARPVSGLQPKRTPDFLNTASPHRLEGLGTCRYCPLIDFCYSRVRQSTSASRYISLGEDIK